MAYSIRKQIWNSFYSIILVDILINGIIKSPTLRRSFNDTYSISLCLAIIKQLKKTFESADLSFVLSYSAQIIEETLSQEEAKHFLSSFSSPLIAL